jgi:hypothetical protein
LSNPGFFAEIAGVVGSRETQIVWNRRLSTSFGIKYHPARSSAGADPPDPFAYPSIR